jgi:phytoene dehydrogenase-like protein
METLIVTDKKIPLENEDATIIFYNESDTYHYQKPQGLFDKTSAVVCFPDNYDQIDRAGEGMIRVTFMANYHQWKNLTKEDYIKNKEDVYTASLNILRKLVPSFNNEIYFKDVFSPTTVEKYTSHLEGTVYGSTDKRRDGKTEITGLYIIGTDQGFLGIVGAMLSGISIGNLYGLMES